MYAWLTACYLRSILVHSSGAFIILSITVSRFKVHCSLRFPVLYAIKDEAFRSLALIVLNMDTL